MHRFVCYHTMNIAYLRGGGLELGIMKAEHEHLGEELEYPQLVHVASRTARNRLHHLEH
jgi:hypothetical protein